MELKRLKKRLSAVFVIFTGFEATCPCAGAISSTVEDDTGWGACGTGTEAGTCGAGTEASDLARRMRLPGSG